MAKKEFRNYEDAMGKLSINKSKYFPEEQKTEDGILVYRIDSNELTICGYRHTPWIGKTKIRLLQGFEKARAGLEVMNGIGLEIDSPVKLSFW